MKTIGKYLIAIVLVFSFVSVSAQSDEKLIRKGNRYYKRGNYTEAEINYKKALEARPNNANAQFNLGDALLRRRTMTRPMMPSKKWLRCRLIPG